MAGKRATFTQADVTRAAKALRAAGLDVVRTEIAPDGKLVFVHNQETISDQASALDQWRAKRDARSA